MNKKRGKGEKINKNNTTRRRITRIKGVRK